MPPLQIVSTLHKTWTQDAYEHAPGTRHEQSAAWLRGGQRVWSCQPALRNMRNVPGSFCRCHQSRAAWDLMRRECAARWATQMPGPRCDGVLGTLSGPERCAAGATLASGDDLPVLSQSQQRKVPYSPAQPGERSETARCGA
jgi:hypothetical protein